MINRNKYCIHSISTFEHVEEQKQQDLALEILLATRQDRLQKKRTRIAKTQLQRWLLRGMNDFRGGREAVKISDWEIAQFEYNIRRKLQNLSEGMPQVIMFGWIRGKKFLMKTYRSTICMRQIVVVVNSICAKFARYLPEYCLSDSFICSVQFRIPCQAVYANRLLFV